MVRWISSREELFKNKNDVTEQTASGSWAFWRLETDRINDNLTRVPKVWEYEMETWN